jgi:fatty acid synthase subunit alpha
MSYDEGVSGGYSARKKAWNQAIELIHDLEPIEVAQSEAERFKYDCGDEFDV